MFEHLQEPDFLFFFFFFPPKNKALNFLHYESIVRLCRAVREKYFRQFVIFLT